ncbi:hypothetical protein A2356_02935 [Candidatus Nomurabacteria bacterium RIFOXYB1_FULL_39_16]|uniref:Polymerase III subunit delta protein n=2 Tax=Candidatus Nomuraibacteriota TaxID=1752729 RepID=A0A0G0R2D7_9BACT|nr:MAG: hypothetical protein UT78_C0001G0077 [Candidatus Nomurabacteria bacterium GW2011_GWF2_40_12]OGJ09483.1 MAG: hypothetical protein A2356_02935 [Candidatus Nomurabacteria bacterium RIFOXYB1_FULL_39_16]
MGILEHLDKNNLHHAYLIEGARDEIVPEVLAFCEDINIKTSGNPDFCHISIDNFKIDEAFDLRAMSTNKSFSSEKRIFLICANSFSLDAENVLLKMFEEPVPDTHFFLIVPDANALLKTLVSRFYLISPTPGVGVGITEAEKFIAMPLRDRIDFIKELLTEIEEEDEEGNEIVAQDSTRSKAIKFLNTLESVLHNNFLKNKDCFEHIFKVREFLRMPGSSTKSLMESVALVIPSF